MKQKERKRELGQQVYAQTHNHTHNHTHNSKHLLKAKDSSARFGVGLGLGDPAMSDASGDIDAITLQCPKKKKKRLKVGSRRERPCLILWLGFCCVCLETETTLESIKIKEGKSLLLHTSFPPTSLLGSAAQKRTQQEGGEERMNGGEKKITALAKQNKPAILSFLGGSAEFGRKNLN